MFDWYDSFASLILCNTLKLYDIIKVSYHGSISLSYTHYFFHTHTHCYTLWENKFERRIILKELKTFSVPFFLSSGFWGPGFQSPGFLGLDSWDPSFWDPDFWCPDYPDLRFWVPASRSWTLVLNHTNNVSVNVL